MNNLGNLEKAHPPPVEDNRSSKKAKFRDTGTDGAPPPPSMSFKDKLLQSNKDREDSLTGNKEDIEITAKDVQIVKEGFMPSISFSQKVHEQLIKPWQKTMVVKLLGRSIGYC